MSEKTDYSNTNGDQEIVEGNTAKSTVSKNSNFFGKIVELITGLKDEERIKLRKLKELSKELNQFKYKFYNYKKDQILPTFGTYIYEIYRLCQNINRFFDIKTHSGSIKQILFESIISDKQKELKQKLEKENLEDLIRNSKDMKKAFDEIKSILNSFIKSFDPEAVKNINSTYNQIVDLSNITNFDWYFLLHKFDASITEGNFNYKPNYELLDGKYILEELVAINDYLQTINLTSDWKNVFEYLKAVSEDHGLANILKKLLNALKILKRDDYFTKMIALITKDPYFKPKQFTSKSKIVQDYIQTYQAEVQKNVQAFVKEVAKEKLNKLLMDIFRTTVIIRLKNYSQRVNDILLNKGASVGFRYVEPLNYLKAFILDICKGEIKTRIDYLIIKGTWDTNAHSSEYSTMLTNFNSISDRIIELDNKCADDEMYGRELKRLYGLLKHDPRSRVVLKKVMTKIDSEALQIIIDAINVLKEGCTAIKILLDDYDSKSPSILINFHKIKWDFSADFKTEFTEIYRKMSNMISLLKTFAKEPDAIPEKENETLEKEENTNKE
jgi:hypothetical protein